MLAFQQVQRPKKLNYPIMVLEWSQLSNAIAGKSPTPSSIASVVHGLSSLAL